MALSEAEKEAHRRYRKKNVSVTVEMYPSTESDIIKRLDERSTDGEPKSSYIKRLIREDIKNSKNESELHN